MRELRAFLPPLALMAVIFVLSGQESLDSGLGWIDTVGRKLVHFGEYALLCALWWRALSALLAHDHALLLAAAVASAYAASDEYHQSFVAGRQGAPVDWLIDTAGAVAAAVLIHRRSLSRRRAPA
ncbi:MAG: VanZ family protein [Actinomycetota bacterium]|nr:VanZ family protein [Actinomycetota bacterium]MDQ3720668.1 VanZ family protein [Actinomycetota bacterium]